MRVTRLCNTLILSIVFAVISCSSANKADAANAPQTQSAVVLPSDPGSEIKYVRIDGTSSFADGMIQLLTQVQKTCGERPSVSRPFHVKNGDSVAAFYQVVDHSQHNRRLQGMLIATQTAPNQVEVAMLTDSAERFPKTMKSMLNKLLASWHPALMKPSSGGAPAAVSPSSLTHKMTARDNSASIMVPSGWTMDPNSGRGAVAVQGPNGEFIALGAVRPAVDPSNRWQMQMASRRIMVIQPGSVVCPFRGDIGREYPNLFNAWRRAAGKTLARSIQVQEVTPLQAAQGNHCAIVKGLMDLDGGTQFFSDMLCASNPDPQFGNYGTVLNHAMLPNSLADKERPLMTAIVSTFKQNEQVVNQQQAQMVQDKKAADDAAYAEGRAAVGRIQQVGQSAMARAQADEAAHDAQHAEYWSTQDARVRRSKEFSDYILDQRVVQDNDIYGNNSGYIGHSTVSNSLADALVASDPNRYEYVDKSGYWRGWDIQDTPH
jgi:hypothetical protein